MSVKRRHLNGSLLLILMLITPVGAWWTSQNGLDHYWQDDVPPGQFLYLMSKLVGLVAVVLLWVHVMFSLLRNSATVKSLLPEWNPRLHRNIGILILIAGVSHFLLYFLAVSLRSESLALQLLLPDLNGFYNQSLSVGWCALVLMMLVASVGMLRNKIGPKWKSVHYLSLPVLIGALVHSYLIGTESQTNTLEIFYAFMAFGLVAGIFLRFKRLRGHR